MTDEQGEQLKLPEDTVQSQEKKIYTRKPDQESTLDKPRKSFSIPEGTIYRTGPYGDRYSQFWGYAPEGSKVVVKNSRVEEGHRSMYVEFESPPEMQGKVGWITPMKDGKGYK